MIDTTALSNEFHERFGQRPRNSAIANIEALRDVSQADLERLAPTLPEPIGRRCRHVVPENQRTVKAADCLRAGDLKGLGMLMDSSHLSLRDN